MSSNMRKSSLVSPTPSSANQPFEFEFNSSFYSPAKPSSSSPGKGLKDPLDQLDTDVFEAKIRTQATAIVNSSLRLIEIINHIASEMNFETLPHDHLYEQVCCVSSNLWRAVSDVVVPYTIEKDDNDSDNIFERKPNEPIFLTIARAISKIFEGPDSYILDSFSINKPLNRALQPTVGTDLDHARGKSGQQETQDWTPQGLTTSNAVGELISPDQKCSSNNTNLHRDDTSPSSNISPIETNQAQISTPVSPKPTETRLCASSHELHSVGLDVRSDSDSDSDSNSDSEWVPGVNLDELGSDPISPVNETLSSNMVSDAPTGVTPPARKKSLVPMFAPYRKSLRIENPLDDRRDRSSSFFRRQAGRSIVLQNRASYGKTDSNIYMTSLSNTRSTVKMNTSEGDRNVVEDDLGLSVRYWDESESDIHSYYYEDETTYQKRRKILAATINKLIHRLTNEEVTFRTYRKVFLTTFPSFMTPIQFMTKLSERFEVPDPPKSLYIEDEEWRQTTRLPIQRAVLDVLCEWISMKSFHINESAIPVILGFLSKAQTSDESHQEIIQNITELLGKKIAAHSKDAKSLFESGNKMPRFSRTMSRNIVILITQFSVEELGDQLTYTNFSLYSAIQSSEFLQDSWSGKDLKESCPNLSRIIDWFNCVSSWVSMSIVRCERLKDRISIYSKFVKLAEYLYQRNNFDSMFAVTSGILSSAIHRLKFTRQGLPEAIQKTLYQISSVISPYGSYKDYRKTVEASTPPIIPYLGVYLTDLTFIEHGNPDLFHGLLNFHKLELVYNVIERVLRYQSYKYDITENYALSEFIDELPYYEDSEIYKLSLQIEPRNAHLDELM